MRTNIDIDDELMEKALKVTGKSTKKDVVAAGLEMLIRVRGQESIRKSRGKISFHPDVIADREKYDIED
jgi:Arc/MetJ family transcription regulator